MTGGREGLWQIDPPACRRVPFALDGRSAPPALLA